MKDLTKGSITRLMIGFAVPILIGSIFQQLYGIIDTKVVSEKLGEEALAAVGAVSPVYNLIIGFAIGLTSGFSIIVARYFGANDMEKMRKSVAGTLMLGLVISAVFTAFSLIFIKPILEILNTDKDLIPGALDYINIIFFGITITMIYNMLSGILRALGDTKAPLVFLAISSVVNVFLDYAMVDKFGIKGAAWATVISQVLSAIMCIVYIIVKCPVLRLKKQDFKIKFSLLKQLFSSGFAMGFMLSFVDIGTVALQSAINSFDDTHIVAAHTAARKISGFLMMPYGAISATVSTFCSQNLGAGKIDRIKKGIKNSILVGWAWSAFVVIFAFTPLCKWTLNWLMGTDMPEALSIAIYYLKINTPFYFILAVLLLLRCAMQGLSRGVVPVVSSFIELVGKLVIAFLFAPMLGYFGVAISEPIIWILCAAWLTFSLFTDKKLYPRKIKKK